MDEPRRFRRTLTVEGEQVPGSEVTFAPGALSWPDSVPLRLGFTDRIIGKVENIERYGAAIRGDIVLAGTAPLFETNEEDDGCRFAAEVMFDRDSPADAPTGTITTVAVVPYAVRADAASAGAPSATHQLRISLLGPPEDEETTQRPIFASLDIPVEGLRGWQIYLGAVSGALLGSPVVIPPLSDAERVRLMDEFTRPYRRGD